MLSAEGGGQVTLLAFALGALVGICVGYVLRCLEEEYDRG